MVGSCPNWTSCRRDTERRGQLIGSIDLEEGFPTSSTRERCIAKNSVPLRWSNAKFRRHWSREVKSKARQSREIGMQAGVPYDSGIINSIIVDVEAKSRSRPDYCQW